jgi:hypothetical protein
MTDQVDIFARSLAIANDSTMLHLLKALREKGSLTRSELKLLLADAIEDLKNGRPSESQNAAAQFVRQWMEKV